VILSSGPFIERTHFPPLVSETQVAEAKPLLALQPGMTVDEAEQQLILITLEHTRDNKTRAAEILGISLKTLHNKLNRLRDSAKSKVQSAK
jgi:DNA-binding NtrC family response regulator